MDFIKVASLSELPEGCSKIVRSKNSKVALFHFNGKSLPLVTLVYIKEAH
jgi:hypothetical protein